MWLLILFIVYGIQISRMGGIRANLPDIFLDLFCVFPALLLFWMAFFSQFVLPVRTFRDRQKIFDRLLTYLFRGHGPALFIENGEIKEHTGELLKKGPGVVWLDSASAAVTRTNVAIKQTLGPGVHFLDKGEFIAGTLDLHTQTQSLGLGEKEDPFAKNTDEQEEYSDDKYKLIQNKRDMVSALTRDGIEVIPNISVTFRVNTGFPEENEPGSRFGYRIAFDNRAKENEKKDKEAIRKAIIGQGIKIDLATSLHRRLAWNELPASLAVDVWREHVAKFTLDELFSQTQDVPPPTEKLIPPLENEFDASSQPVTASISRNTLQVWFIQILHEINLLMSQAVNWLEGKKKDKSLPKTETLEQPAAITEQAKETHRKTALQVINDMVKARLTQPQVEYSLDDTGKRILTNAMSDEYKLLEDRGLKVLSVNISNLRLDPKVDDHLITHWSATWLKNAEAEKEQIERRQNIVKNIGQERAIYQYADLLSSDLLRRKPGNAKESLKALLMRTRAIVINDPQLSKHMNDELPVFEDILRWVEANGK